MKEKRWITLAAILSLALLGTSVLLAPAAAKPGAAVMLDETPTSPAMMEADSFSPLGMAWIPDHPTGSILREWWDGIPGPAVADLVSNPNYPDHPSGRDCRSSFEAPSDRGDQYGTRMRGYLYPPVTADYTFWIASDDNSELWLSTDESSDKPVLIARMPGWAPPREYDILPEQQSAPIHLEAGRRYYIEARHKEAGGQDSLSVAWLFPQPMPVRRVILGSFLSPASTGRVGCPEMVSPPQPTPVPGTGRYASMYRLELTANMVLCGIAVSEGCRAVGGPDPSTRSFAPGDSICAVWREGGKLQGAETVALEVWRDGAVADQLSFEARGNGACQSAPVVQSEPGSYTTILGCEGCRYNPVNWVIQASPTGGASGLSTVEVLPSDSLPEAILPTDTPIPPADTPAPWPTPTGPLFDPSTLCPSSYLGAGCVLLGALFMLRRRGGRTPGGE